MLLFILVYLLSNLAIGAWAARRVRSARDFALAGRRLPLLLASTALFATWFGAETILGAPSEFLEHGLIGIVEDPLGAALCLFLVGIFYARPLYKLNILTFCDFFGIRFGEKSEVLSALLIIPSYFGWIAAQMVAFGLVWKQVTGMELWTGILLCAAVVIVYTWMGGLWAVSITDFVQTVLIIGGLVFIAATLTGRAGGLGATLSSLSPDQMRLWPEPGWLPSLEYLAAWITIGLGSIPQQDIFQRVMAAKSASTAVRAAILSGFMYLSVGLIPLLIAMAGRAIHQGPIADFQEFLPALINDSMPLFLRILFFGALLSAIMSTSSGAILAPATVLAENLLKKRFRNLRDQQLLRLMRLSVAGIALLSAAMALYQGNIFDLVSQSSAFSLVCLFWPLSLGLFSKKGGLRAANTSMLGGLLVWLPCEILGTDIPAILLGLGGSILGWYAGRVFEKGLEKEDAADA